MSPYTSSVYNFPLQIYWKVTKLAHYETEETLCVGEKQTALATDIDGNNERGYVDCMNL